MKRPGVVRECEHPGRPHSHGRECYRYDECRCALGRGYQAAKEAKRRKRKALGFGPAFVDATGARRRLQALMTLGYTATQLGRSAGVSRYVIHDIIETQRLVQRGKLALVADLYDELWDAPPPANQGQRYVSNMAARRGWAPPMAWDDDTIDDPTAEPRLEAAGEFVDQVLVSRVLNGEALVTSLSQLEKDAAARVLIKRGYRASMLAKRLNVSGSRAARWMEEVA